MNKNKFLLSFLVFSSIFMAGIAQGYKVTVHPENRVASMILPPQVYEDWAFNDSFSSDEKRKAITKEVYKSFYDEFDFIYYILDEEELNSSFSYWGKCAGVSNKNEGLGIAVYDNTNAFGSEGKLKCVMHLPVRKAILSGPNLHELMHNWANFGITTGGYDGGPIYDYSGHWGFTGGSNRGQLGGFTQDSLKTNVGGNPNRYKVDRFGQNANGGNGVPYTDLELYMMGLIPATDVAPFDVFNDITDFDQTTYEFTAETRTSYTPEKLVEELGARVPNAQDAQKEFKTLFLIITKDELSDSLWTYYNDQVEEFCRKGSDEKDWLYNFWEATRGLASINPSGLEKAMKNRGNLLVNTLNDGTILYRNSEHTIAWTNKTDEAVKIELYQNGEFRETLASNISGTDTTFTWTIGNDFTMGDNLRIKITSLTNDDSFDFTDEQFSIRMKNYTVSGYAVDSTGAGIENAEISFGDKPVLDIAIATYSNAYPIGSNNTNWQTFIPQASTLSQIDFFIQRSGDINDLTVVVKDNAGNTVWNGTIPEKKIPESTIWVSAEIVPAIPIIAGETYTVFLSSEGAIQKPSVFWVMDIASQYTDGVSNSTYYADMDYCMKTYSGNGLSTKTNADGFYSINVVDGWTGSLAAEAVGHEFTTSTFTYENIATDHLESNYYERCKTLLVFPTELALDNKQVERVITVQSNENWTYATDADWVNCSKNPSGNLLVSFTANDILEERYAQITITSESGNESRLIDITQSAGIPFVSLNTDTINLSFDAGNFEIEVLANIEWEVYVDQSWITVEKTDDKTLSVQYDKNEAQETLYAEITVSAEGIAPQTIIVAQAQEVFQLTLSKNEFSFDAKAIVDSIDIVTNTDIYVDINDAWLDYSFNDDNTRLYIYAEENTSEDARTGSLTINGDYIDSQTITVTQSGKGFYLELSKNSVTLSSKAGTDTLVVHANGSWSLDYSADWIEYEYYDDTTIVFSYNENSEASARSVSITITQAELEQVYTITQNKPTVIDLPIVLTYEYIGDSLTVLVSSTLDWTFNETPQWIQAEKVNDSLLSIECSSNSSFDGRSFDLVVSIDGFDDKTIKIVQNGKENILGIDRDTVYLAATAGTEQVILTGNLECTTASTASWLSSTIENDAVVITYSANESTASRQASVKVESAATSVFIIVIQEGIGSTLTVSASEMLFEPTMVQNTVTVTSTDNWDFTNADAWIHCSKSGTNTLVIEAEQNSLYEDRVATITITTQANISRTIVITQKAKIPSISISPINTTVGSDAGSVLFTVEAPENWSTESTANWYSVAKINETTLELSYQKNTNLDARTGEIVISALSNYSERFSFAQNGTTSAMAISPINKEVSADAGSYILTIESQTEWQYVSSIEWIQAVKKSETELEISYDDNLSIEQRTATLSIENQNDEVVSVTLIQSAATATQTVQYPETAIEYNQETFEIVVKSNSKWTISTTTDWATIAVKNDTLALITFGQNLSMNDRSADFIIKDAGGNTEIFSVLQTAGAVSIIIETGEVTLVSDSTQQLVLVQANTSWVVQSTEDWLIATNQNDTAIRLEYVPNEQTEARIATVNIIVDGVTVSTFNVTQAGTAIVIETETVIETKTETVTEIASTEVGKLEAYPNPTSDYASINLDYSGDITIAIYTSTGVLVTTMKTYVSNTVSIDMNDFAEGLYYIHLSNNEINTETMIVKE